MMRTLAILPLCWLFLACVGVARAENCDILIRGGTVYDGSGARPRQIDVALRGDRIAAVGHLGDARAKTVVDAKGLAVAPGFINMLSWSVDSLLADGRSQSEVRQGVTVRRAVRPGVSPVTRFVHGSAPGAGRGPGTPAPPPRALR